MPAATPQPASTPAATPQPTSAPPVASSGEWVMAAVAGLTLKKGFMGLSRTTYALVATNLRLVFVELTSEMLTQASMDAREQAKADGKGFFRQWGAQLGALNAFGDRFAAMSVGEVFAQFPNAWSLDRSGIKKAKLRRGSPGDDEAASTPDTLVLKCTDGKYSFEVADYRRAKDGLTAAGLI
jgi:hypothetical protein